MTLTLPVTRNEPFTATSSSAVCSAPASEANHARIIPTEHSRRYSRSIYLWTLSQWDVNRADIERRTATVALNAILSGQRVGTPSTSASSSRMNSVDDSKDMFFDCQ